MKKNTVRPGPEDYRRLRRGLLLLFWGMFYYLVLFIPVQVVSGMLGEGLLPRVFFEFVPSALFWALMMAGLWNMGRLKISPLYRGRLRLSMFFGSLWIFSFFGRLVEPLPEAISFVLQLCVFFDIPLAVLLYLLALQELARGVDWVGVKQSIRRTRFFVLWFWLGADLLFCVLVLSAVGAALLAFFKPVTGLMIILLLILGGLTLFVLHLLTLIRIWSLTGELLRTSRLRWRVAAMKKLGLPGRNRRRLRASIVKKES